MLKAKLLRMIQERSQWEVAVETGIPNYRLSRIESGKATATPEEVNRLAAALGAPPEQIVKPCSAETLLRG